MIGRQDHFKATFKQSVDKPPKRSPLGPVPHTRMQTVGSCDDAVQHLINRTEHDASNPAPRLIDLCLDTRDERIVVF